ncbi:MAG: hypothetical protein AB7C98_01050 [Acidithiobacillus sp.]
MFYFVNPMYRPHPLPPPPPAMERVMAPPPAPVLPKGWQWGKSTKVLPSPQPPMPMNPASAAAHRFAVCMRFANEPTAQRDPLQVTRPTWSVVSWKNLAPHKMVGTQEEVVATVEKMLSAAGVHHVSITAYGAIHVIVALQN